MIRIDIKNISKKYDEKSVFDNLCESFEAGKVNVYMGTSGCGKTTLLNIIAGLSGAQDGRVVFTDEVSGKEKTRKDIKFSMIFQEYRLCENMTTLSNVMFACKRKQKSHAMEVLEELGLKECANEPAGSLSGGMKARVAIARALIADYDVMLADEPFTGLDDTTKRSVMECFKKMTKGKTVILVTHSEDEKGFFDGEDK